MRRARPPVRKAYRHGRFAPCGLDEETLVLGVREILLRSYETSTEHGAGSAREQRLANLPAVTDPAGSQYGRTLRTLQHLRKQFVECAAGLNVTAVARFAVPNADSAAPTIAIALFLRNSRLESITLSSTRINADKTDYTLSRERRGHICTFHFDVLPRLVGFSVLLGRLSIQ